MDYDMETWDAIRPRRNVHQYIDQPIVTDRGQLIELAKVWDRGGRAHRPVGRPDLARPRLAAVIAPTLLIVGGHDDVVLDLNRRAQRSYGG